MLSVKTPWHLPLVAVLLAAGMVSTRADATASVPQACAPGKPNVIWVGKEREIRTITAAIEAAMKRDRKGRPVLPTEATTFCIEAGVYDGDFPGDVRFPATFIGVGGFAEVRNTTGNIGNRKAMFITTADVTFENIIFRGARVGHQNGAGIRMEGHTLTIKNCIFADNENGILTASESVVPGVQYIVRVEDSQFLRNGWVDGRGRGKGKTHGIYAGDLDELTVTGSYFVAQREGHHIKSRAKRTVITNSTLDDGLDGPQQIASYSVDASDGGIVETRGNTIVQRTA